MKRVITVLWIMCLVLPVIAEEGEGERSIGQETNEIFKSVEDDPELLEGKDTLDAGERVTKWKDGLPFDFGVSLDVYGQANFAGKTSNDIINESFSTQANSFELGMINVMAGKDFGKVGFMADLAFGPRANSANGIDLGSIATIKQLYLTYAPADFVQFTLGNFSTFFGWELIEPQNNFHYSTSLAFQNGPFYHTGIKANFTKGDWNFMVGAFNDTDAKSDGDRNKFVGAQVGYSGSRFSTYINYVGGNEGAVFDNFGNEIFSKSYKSSFGISSEAIVGENEGGSVVLDLAYHRFRMPESATDNIMNTDYFTAYAYGQASVCDNGVVGARVGYAMDKDGFIGDADNFVDFTLTYNHTIAGLLTLVPEFKIDYADEKVYFRNDGSAASTQFRLLLAAIFAI